VTSVDVLTPTGVLVPRLEPGTGEWLRVMSASKIAAVVGLSPWESRFSLYHRMKGNLGDDSSDATRRGHYLEAGVAAWFADQNPDWRIDATGTWLHPDRPWQVATPDRLVTLPDGTVELLEVKTAGDSTGWGDAGTDEIPAYYRPQVQWQLDTLGLRRCHVAVLLPFLAFRSYVVDLDETDAAYLRDEGRQFLDDLEHDRLPSIDGHTATYEAVAAMHPQIEDVKVDVPDDVAQPYLAALVAEKDAQAEKRRTGALLLEHMGSAKDAFYRTKRIASRQARSDDAAPYLCAAKGVADHFRSAA
jgi:putative phage-type endonuclease